MKRWFCFLLLAGLLMGVRGTGFAAGYPERQVEIILAFPPGGSIDTLFRIVQNPMAAALGVPIVITTKAGAAGALGVDYVSKAKPDGYTTLGGDTSSLLVAPTVNPAITYRFKDFISICQLGSDPILVCSPAGSPWKNLDEMVAHAKKNPGKLNYGSTGMGTTSFFSMELFKISYGLDIVPVHFQGTGPVKNAVMGGHVNLAAVTFSPMIPLIRAGKVIPLLTSSLKRIPDFPDIPTLAEKGFAEASLNMAMGLYVYHKSPKEVVEKLTRAMEKVGKDPAVEAQVRKAGLVHDYLPPEATLKLMEQQSQMLSRVVQKVGIGK